MMVARLHPLARRQMVTTAPPSRVTTLPTSLTLLLLLQSRGPMLMQHSHIRLHVSSRQASRAVHAIQGKRGSRHIGLATQEGPEPANTHLLPRPLLLPAIDVGTAVNAIEAATAQQLQQRWQA
ncbi:hypothetical protein PLESTM_001461300 [Pleodorina starrii]|nr:hypothetical protein PLESTM_001461300 [Pleodorina starrii]